MLKKVLIFFVVMEGIIKLFIFLGAIGGGGGGGGYSEPHEDSGKPKR